METVIRTTVFDPAYWLQCICAAVFSYTVLGLRRSDLERLAVPVGKVLFLMISFLLIHVSLSLLTLRFFILAGVGTWLSYLGGVVLFTALFSKYGKNARLITAGTAFSTIITVFELGSVLGRTLEYIVEDFDSLYTKIAASFLLLAAGYALRKYPISHYDISIHAVRLNLISCVMSAVSVVVFDLFTVHVLPRGGDLGVNALMSVILFVLYVINTVCYLMTYQISREYTSVLDLTAERQMDKSASSLMAITQSSLTELHKIRHDIENQYAYMRAMLDSGDYDGLRGYFDELTGSFSQPLVPILDCGNHTMNLIFNMLIAKAREVRVRLDIKAALPHRLPFRDLDLVKLYTNVIDNAIEACAAEGLPDPTVAVTVNVAGEYLFTRVTNPTTKGSDFLTTGPSTTKSDARLHGKGMSIATGIVQKYGGSIRYFIEKSMFFTEYILCLKEASYEQAP